MDKELLKILACPDCKGELVLKSNTLKCKKCSRKYKIEEGIPNLMPKSL
jgi:hypothetical protein